MKIESVRTLLLLCVAVAMVWWPGQATMARAESVWLGHMKADRILFLGNSITLHPPAAHLEWYDNWGMAASTQAKDYVHLLASAIDARTGGTLRIAPTDPAVTNPDGTIALGDANVLNVADLFERQYRTYEASKIQQQLAAKPDIVVLQFGENIPMESFDSVAFTSRLRQLMTDLKDNGNPNIFVTGLILGSNPTVDNIKRQLCAEDPSHRFFVDMSGFLEDSANIGFLAHPSDKGMEYIADTIFAAMVAQSVPEPSSLAAVISAVAVMGLGVVWRRRLR